MAYDDVITRNEDGELAVRTVSVSEGNAPANYDDVMTRDENGNLAVRVIGNGGGGDTHNKGYFATQAALEEAYPTGEAGDYAIVGSTDTVWIWDTDNSEWVDSDTKGQVTSVNNQTGDVTLTASDVGAATTAQGIKADTAVQPADLATVATSGDYDDLLNKPTIPQDAGDVGAVPQYDTMPTADASNVGNLVQYSGESIADSYQNGYFYVSQPTYTDQNATISQTAGGNSISFETTIGNTTISGDMQAFNNLLTDAGLIPSDMPSTGTLLFTWHPSDDAWFLELPLSGWGDYFSQEFLEEIGFTFTGTPVDGDKITATYNFGLLNLSVDVDAFVEAEQPTQDEEVDFTASVVGRSVVFTQQTTWGINATADDINALYLENGVELDSSTSTTTNLFIIYYNENNVGFGVDGVTLFNPTVADLAVHNITFTGTPVSGENITGVYTRPETVWEKDSETVDISAYGISYNGTPTNGDTLTVAYTASSISGYAWNQINVQPGGTEGIKWTGHWDKPADMHYYWYCAGFDFAILPAGTYEFYFQNKQLRNRVVDSSVWGTKTWKATIVVATDGDSRQVSGTLAWVLDGQTTFGSYNLSTDANCNYYTDMTTKDRIATLVIQTAGMISNDIEQQSIVPELFRWTNIKNIDTGLEYPVTVDVVQENAPQLTYYLGNITSGSAVNPPERAVYQRVFDAVFTDNQQRFALGNTYDANETRTGSFAECDLEMVTANGHYRAKITNYIRSSILRVYEASGDLANVQIGTLDEGELQIMLNTPTGTTGDIRAVASVSGSSNYFYLNGLYEPWTFTRVLTPTKIGGTVTSENFGMILQYDGATDSNYTNGYFYKAAGTKVVTPKSIAFSDYNLSATVSVTDIDALITEIQNFTGWSTSDIENNLGGQYTWQISYSTTDGVTYVNFGFWNTFEAAILQYISVTYDQDGDITCLATYTPETTTITNGRWERVDVQPSLESISGYDATKTQTLKNVQGVLTWVDDQ